MARNPAPPRKRFDKPAHWSNAPAPAPAVPAGETDALGPTRYGDWVKNGIAIDF